MFDEGPFAWTAREPVSRIAVRRHDDEAGEYGQTGRFTVFQNVLSAPDTPSAYSAAPFGAAFFIQGCIYAATRSPVAIWVNAAGVDPQGDGPDARRNPMDGERGVTGFFLVLHPPEAIAARFLESDVR